MEEPTHLAGPRVEPLALADRMLAGRALRERLPRGAHGAWVPPAGRPDPISLLEEQAKDRLPELMPVRYGRMRTSPFAFLRGAAIVMASDLSRTPTTGITVQACGDAHMLNFGVFATPERNVVFDLNDFDETLPGPWEWDLKRLAASLAVAGRQRGFSARQSRLAVTGMTRAYARWLREFATMRYLDVWYSKLDVDMILAALSGKQRARTRTGIAKARLRDHLHAQAKLTEVVAGRRRIVDNPPLVERLPQDARESEVVRGAFEDYLRTLQPDRRALLSRYRVVDAAVKVVGVGSVGTRCYIVLLTGAHDEDPLFLQVKEAAPSVLERYQPRSRFRNNGRRVVEGQRMIQAASDAFLGWIRGRGGEGRDFYWRQLHDVKGSIDPEAITPGGLARYATACGATLARACARSGDAATISGYIGTGPKFPEAIASFAEAYADQTERDHELLVEAISTGRLLAHEGV